jgi:hypothetical protein
VLAKATGISEGILYAHFGVSVTLAAMSLVLAQIESIRHRFVQVNGIKMHIAEQGEGP